MDDCSSSSSIFNLKKDESKFIIIPVPYEKSTSFIKGTSNGPSRILEVFDYQEFFGEECDCYPCEYGVYIEKEVKNLKEIPHILKSLKRGQIPILIGGEHTISYEPIKFFHQRYKKLNIIQLDAHCDLRDEYLGERLCHATYMRRVTELGDELTLYQIGIRTFEKEEIDFIKKNHKKIKTFFLGDLNIKGFHPNIISIDPLEESHKFMIEEIYYRIKDDGPFYITIDADFFSLCDFPGVGNPESGGLPLKTTLNLLKKLITRGDRQILGIDLVEVSPIPNNPITEYNAAKLIYKIMEYIILKDRKII